MSHNADGSIKLRSFRFSAWVSRRYHKDDFEIPPGEFREPDRWLEISGTTDVGQAIRFLERARKEGRKVSGVLISVLDDP